MRSKAYDLLDHDGVLVDTEQWCFAHLAGLARFGASPGETVVVEDSAQDFSGASHRVGTLAELKEIVL